MWWQNNRLDAGAVATLVGALFGGAALLLGNGINSIEARARSEEELATRQLKLKTLITAELVSIVADLISIKQKVDAARISGGTYSVANFSRNLPSDLPLTFGLGHELLVLDQPALDALVTLRVNLEMSREAERAADPNLPLGQLMLGALANRLSHDMGILAECFERIAPTRKLSFPGEAPELASVILRKASN
jgi:hypothetical protein